jgi:hypothetical protein
MKTQTTLAEFIKANGITMTCQQTPKNPHMDSSIPMDHWFCSIRNQSGAIIGIHFSTGTGLRKERDGLGKKMTWEQYISRPNHGSGGNYKQTVHHSKLRADYEFYLSSRMTPTAPEVADVLDCLASDASGVENSRDFEEWCSEYGYDTDSRKAEKTYRICAAQAEQLKSFLGEDLYKQLLWDTERQ